MADHTYEQHKNCPRPGCCPICDGGLSSCTACGGLEGALPSECPGGRMTDEQVDAVYAGRLDYRGGRWVEGASIHCPAYRHSE